jgi:hypothetical protein
MSVALLANGSAAFFAMAPALFTFAEVVPHRVECSLCSVPEVQTALIHAASAAEVKSSA